VDIKTTSLKVTIGAVSPNIEQEHLGDLISKLKEILPEFTTVEDSYIFQSKVVPRVLIINPSEVFIQFNKIGENNFIEDLSRILAIVKEYITDESAILIANFKFLVKKDTKWSFKKEMIDSFEKIHPGTVLRSIGLELPCNTDFLNHFNLQLRRDLEEIMVTVNISSADRALYQEIAGKIFVWFNWAKEQIMTNNFFE